MANENELKEIPYAVSDFKTFSESNYYFVDKTRYIRDIEKKGRYLFLIRPRRFGKSLFLSIMECYYDIELKDKFDFIFANTGILETPTPERNRYMILKLNFAMVEADVDKVEEAFLEHIRDKALHFIKKYQNYLDIDTNKVEARFQALTSASMIMGALLSYCLEKKQKLYVIIDEYDNFANTILSTSGQQSYIDITQGEGFLRSFFNVVKGGTTGTDAPISRLFMTGVSPITLDDVTSGFNIGSSISLHSDINEIMGFNRGEVETMIDYYRQSGKIRHSTTELLLIMSQWYNHYRFSSHSVNELFNTVHVLYFLKEYMVDSEIPGNLIDRNALFDYKKLRHLIIIDKEGANRTNGNFSRLQQILETGGVNANLQAGFPIEALVKPENFISLLFYFGLLTIRGTTLTGQTIFSIPNEFVRRLFYDFIKDTYEDTKIFSLDMTIYSNLLEDFAVAGKWQPFIEYIAGRMEASLGIRDLMISEKAHQVFWNVYLGLNPLYMVYSEKELNQGFSDLVMVPMTIQYPAIKYTYLLELKYIKPSDFEKEDAAGMIGSLRLEAEGQLRRYCLDEKFIKSIGQTTLKKLILIFSGNRLVHHSETDSS
ncbi:MAG: ATP-binding protein [Acidobacteria bacterium]|jgi:hypothetical protein|nr:ATP-binding protein [Acidobacteriota bacterium]